MLVKLARAWFGPDASLHPEGENYIPLDWEEQLPPGAEILDREAEAPVEEVDLELQVPGKKKK